MTDRNRFFEKISKGITATSKTVKDTVASYEKTLIDWVGANITIKDTRVVPLDLKNSETLKDYIRLLLYPCDPVIVDFIARLAHQNGFLTAMQNQTYYTINEQNGIAIKVGNASYKFTRQANGDVCFEEKFDILSFRDLKDVANDEEKIYKPDEGSIATVTATSIISIKMNEKNEKVAGITLQNTKVENHDKEYSDLLFNIKGDAQESSPARININITNVNQGKSRISILFSLIFKGIINLFSCLNALNDIDAPSPHKTIPRNRDSGKK